MDKKILVILGHPNDKSLNRLIADNYIEGAKESHDVDVIYLSEIKFDPILHKGYGGKQPLEKDLVDAQRKIAMANHLVFFYPIWWGAPPAILKGFFDRVFAPGFAFKYENGKAQKLLKGKTGSMIMTAGGPKMMYSLFGWVVNKPITSGVMKFCGIKPKSTEFFCAITNNIKPERVEQIAKRAKKLGQKGF